MINFSEQSFNCPVKTEAKDVSDLTEDSRDETHSFILLH